MKIMIVEDLKEQMRKDDEYILAVGRDETEIDPERAKPTIVMTPEVFAKIFSPEKLRLLLRIKRNKISNIYQIAKETGRKYEAVHRDIKDLRQYGLIKMKRKGKGLVPYLRGSIRFEGLFS